MNYATQALKDAAIQEARDTLNYNINRLAQYNNQPIPADDMERLIWEQQIALFQRAIAIWTAELEARQAATVGTQAPPPEPPPTSAIGTSIIEVVETVKELAASDSPYPKCTLQDAMWRAAHGIKQEGDIEGSDIRGGWSVLGLKFVDNGDPQRKLSKNEALLLTENENLAKINPNPDVWFGQQGYPQFLEPADVDRVGNYLTLGPIGAYSEFEVLLLALMFGKMSQTPEGMKLAVSIINKYLDGMTRIITSMQHASASSPITALFNQYACTNIYERMGLISPYNAQRTKKWLDHIWGQILDKSWGDGIMNTVTTLVQSAEYQAAGQYGGGGAGLGAFAKILGGA